MGDSFMATVAGADEDRRVSIGRVFQRAFSAITFNPLVILGLALVVGAIPGIIMTYFFYRMGIGAPNALRAGASMNAMIGAGAVTTILSLVISSIVQGALTRATVSASEGRKVTFGESLATGLRVILPLIALSILLAIGLTVGFILLVIPGIVLLLMWAVAVPSLVIERAGVFAAFSRSAELTKGEKWKILALFIVLLVGYWLLSAAVALIGLGTFNAANLSAGGPTIANAIGGVIVGTIFNAVWGTIQPSLYVELRQAKEGGSMENLEAIFA
jgi:hypothetical protein